MRKVQLNILELTRQTRNISFLNLIYMHGSYNKIISEYTQYTH